LYPLFLTTPDADIAHAHNQFLQVALDLGLPGLMAYLALIGTALWLSLRVARSAGDEQVAGAPSDGQTRGPGPAGGAKEAEQAFGGPDADSLGSNRLRWVGLGLVGSLVAFHVFGLMDAVALGAKPGVALWMILGMAAGLPMVSDPL
jgi:putative inorganic carbon (HCO3(-)) transporter